MTKKEDIINKNGGIDVIRQLPLLATGVEKSKLETCYKIAKALKRPKAAFAVMKRAGTLVSNEIVGKEEFSKIERRAVKQYFSSLETKKDEEILNETSNIAWLRKEYVRLFDDAMKKEKYAEALDLTENLEECSTSRERKNLAIDALIKQKTDLGLFEEAEKLTWNYRCKEKIEAAMEKEYNEKNIFDYSIIDRAKNFGGSENFYENMPYLKDKIILDIACGSSGSGESSSVGVPDLYWVPKLCRNLEFLCAKPIGIDKGANYGEKFQCYQRDLIHGNFPYFENESLDGINCQLFISLDRDSILSKYREYYQDILKRHKVTIDGVDFYAGLGSNTSPALQSKWNREKNEEYIATCSDIVSRIFVLAAAALKENAIISFDFLDFIKKDGVLKFKGTYKFRRYDDAPKNIKEKDKSKIFVPKK